MRYSKKKRNIRNKKRVVSSKRLQKAGYSKKKRIHKSRKNKKVISRKRQKGGGALNSIMSMVPFMSSEDDIEFDENAINDVDETQNVLVSALCNQYVKNNIRGTIKTEYDPVLDSLCAGANISSLPRNNNINNFSSNSVSLKQKRSKKKPVKLSQKADVVEVEKSQSGGVKLPTFLSGIKGLASFYSLPLRTGIKAVNSGINTIKEYSSKKKSQKSESESESESNASSNSSKKVKKNKESSSSGSSSSDIDSDIQRAEAEILKETSSNNEARNEVVNNLMDNKNLDINEVIKK